MLATIETNHLMQGDSVNLSTDYVARQLLMESARRYYLSRGTTPINMRGMGTRLLTLIQTYGAVPFDAYHAYHPVNYNVVARKLQLASRSTTNFNHLDSRANSILDEAIGYLPGPKVYMLGAEYTPLEFAHSVCQEDEYQAITSFTHHPFGSHFVLEDSLVFHIQLCRMLQKQEWCIFYLFSIAYPNPVFPNALPLYII